MPRPLKSGTARDVHKVTLSLIRLREIRDDLSEAGADNAAAQVRRAIGSTEGALRHVKRREALSNPQSE